MPIRHNPGVSLPLIISGHGLCGHPWLSRSGGGPFSLAAREGLTVVLGIWEPYIPYPIKKGIILVCHYLRLFQVMDSVVIHGSLGQRDVFSLWLPGKD